MARSFGSNRNVQKQARLNAALFTDAGHCGVGAAKSSDSLAINTANPPL
jgi:hypothetical protein